MARRSSRAAWVGVLFALSVRAVACALFAFSFGAIQLNAQSPAPEAKEKPKAEEKKEPKPVKPIQKPCAGKLVAMHAYSVCGPDKVWHVVEDDYYDCPPVQRFRVWDHATEQPCDKPPPNPITEGFTQFNGSGCVEYKDIGPMDIYECYNGLWYLVTYEVYECSDGRRLVSLKDRKETGKPCKDPKPELKLPVVEANETVGPGMPDDKFASALRDNKVKLDVAGTGETIGPVATISIQNLTDQPIAFTIPPVVLESRSGKNQDYVIPQTEDVALKPHESKKIPLNGVCVDRHKPPVGKGVGGDLAFNDPSGHVPRDEHSHVKRDDADKLLRIAKSKQDAANKLEDDGLLKDMPYKEKKKRKEIVEQWSTWADPRISEIEGGPPATKDDLKKVVEKQVGEVPPEEKKKIDKGIDTIWEKIELTTTKAKDLEKENENKAVESDNPAANTFEISDNTPTPQPGTEEKKKKEGKKKDKKKKYPPDIQKWVDAMTEYDKLDYDKNIKENAYKTGLKKWGLEHSKHYKELSDAADNAKQKLKDAAKNGGKPPQEDFDNVKKAQEELDKFEKEIAKDFQKTEVGKGLFKDFADAEDLANRQKARADEAGKDIDPEVKKEILEKERD